VNRRWEQLTCFWRSRGGLQHSVFFLLSSVYDFSLLFSFCFGDDEGDGLLLGFFLFLICSGAIEKTVMLTLVFWVHRLHWSLFLLRVLFFCLCFLGFLFLLLGVFSRSPPFREVAFVLSLYRASGSLGGGNGWPPKSALAANGRNVSAFNGRAVAE